MAISTEFRALVSSEVATWFTSNASKVDVLLGRVAEAIQPAVTEEVNRGLLTYVGVLDPNERERVTILLRQIDVFMVRFASPPREATAELGRVRDQIAAVCRALGERIPGETGASPADAT